MSRPGNRIGAVLPALSGTAVAVLGFNGSVAAGPPCAQPAAHCQVPDQMGHGADGVKLAAAWLVDYCGWRGYREGDIGVSESQALVLVNHGGCKGRDLVTLSGRIRDSVYSTFAIRLQTEPVVL